jgi:hypothetical protein
MNKSYNSFTRFLFLTLLFLILVFIFSKYYNNYITKESFVPKKFKEMYRPIARNVRNNYEGIYNNSSLQISNLFRKFGIL